MLNLTLPQIRDFYPYEKVEESNILKHIGPLAPSSDVAKARGGFEHDGKMGYWTLDYHGSMLMHTVSPSAEPPSFLDFEFFFKKHPCIRPVFKFSSLEEVKKMVGELEDLEDGIKRGILYLPLYAASTQKQDELSDLLNSRKLTPLGNVNFPTESNKYNDFGAPINRYYEYNGELYLLLEVDYSDTSNNKDRQIQLSNGKSYKNGDLVFIKVEGTDLYVDERSKKAFIDPVVTSGISIDPLGYDLDSIAVDPFYFNETGIGRYLNERFLKELLKLQQAVREIKGKSLSNIEPVQGVPVPDETDAEEMAEELNRLRVVLKKTEENILRLLAEIERNKRGQTR